MRVGQPSGGLDAPEQPDPSLTAGGCLLHVLVMLFGPQRAGCRAQWGGGHPGEQGVPGGSTGRKELSVAVGQARPKIHRSRWSQRRSFLTCHHLAEEAPPRVSAPPTPVRLVNAAVLGPGLASPGPGWLPPELQPACRRPSLQGREAHGAERPAALCPGAPMSPLGVRVCSLGGRGTHLPAVPGSTGAQAVGRTLPVGLPEEGLSEVTVWAVARGCWAGG